MPVAAVGDIHIYYEIHGDGEPLLLIMGYGANSSWWFNQKFALSREYRVIVFDNRGTGRSDKPDTRCTIKIMAGDAAGLLDAIRVDAAHVFGMSMGGMIAQELALNYPDKVLSLILGSTTPGGRNTTLPDQEATAFLFDHEHRHRLSPEEQARELLPFLFSDEFIKNNGHLTDAFAAEISRHPTPIHGYRRHEEAIMSFNVYDRIPGIGVPTLVMAGTADKLIPVENSRILASRIPGAELIIFDNIGHNFIGEIPVETNRAVLEFLKKHSRSRQALS